MRFFDRECKIVFREIVNAIYPVFQKYGVIAPTLRSRSMDTRWGSCLPKEGIITLNKRLLEAPRNCIEYVVMHEFCHFIHPNHSKNFYDFLSMLMPDWKKRKKTLDANAMFYLWSPMEHLLSAGHSYRQAVSRCYPDAICLLGQNPQSPRSELCSGCAFVKCFSVGPKQNLFRRWPNLLYLKNPLHTDAAIWYDMVN